MISNANLQIFSLFILFVMLANNHHILAYGVNRESNPLPQSLLLNNGLPKAYYDRDAVSHETLDDDIPSSDLWSVIFRPSNIPAIPGISFRRGVTQLNGFKKRKIPLELQKALYAHGIVGRRR